MLLSDLLMAGPAAAGGRAPVARPDSYIFKAGTQVSVNAARGVLRNDRDPERDRLTAVLVSPPLYGTFQLRPNGAFTYKPQFVAGTVNFTYSAFDGKTNSEPVTVTIKLDATPVAVGDFWGVIRPGTLTVAAPGILENDYDLGGDVLTPLLVRPPAHGKLKLQPDGGFVYTPAARFVGKDSFTYRVTDGRRRSPAVKVRLRVATTNAAPTAVADSYRFYENNPVSIGAPGLLANDTDPEGDPLRVELVSAPGGVDSWEFRPDGSFDITPLTDSDQDITFSYRVTDTMAYSPPVVVTVDMVAINNPPTGVDDYYEFNQDLTADIPAPGVLENDYDDVEFDSVRVFDLVQGTAHGTLTLRENGSFTYKPNPGYVGFDGFSYRPGDAGPGNVTNVALNVLGNTG
jgi:hypothetical protein